jgi:hypothetical protein
MMAFACVAAGVDAYLVIQVEEQVGELVGKPD